MRTANRLSDNPVSTRHAQRDDRNHRNARLPATMPLGQFLFAYLHHRGVRHSFGVPGDFALPTFAWLEKSPSNPSP